MNAEKNTIHWRRDGRPIGAGLAMLAMVIAYVLGLASGRVLDRSATSEVLVRVVHVQPATMDAPWTAASAMRKATTQQPVKP